MRFAFINFSNDFIQKVAIIKTKQNEDISTIN